MSAGSGTWQTPLFAGAWGAGGFGLGCLLVGLGAAHGASLLFLALLSSAGYAGLLDLHHRLAPAPALGEGRFRFTADLIRAAVLFAGAWAFATAWRPAAPSGAAFFDTPLVGYRVEIAIAGAFAVSLLVRLMRFWRPRLPAWLLVQGALFWVSPFYGFFSAPIFAAMGLSGLGPMRESPDLALVAAAMLIAEWCGWGVALWFTAPIRAGRR
jgi:hypothetical protein